MQKWGFNLEVISPLILSGASPNETEFRPPSIKNLMGFWYRTCFDTVSLKETLESSIYGSIINQGKFKPTIKNINNLLIKDFKKGDFDSGINYLGFSLDFGSNHRKYIAPRLTVDPAPGTTFDLYVKYFGNSDEEKKAILASLWLLLWLGNLGTRSRRGFGSLSLTNKPLEDTHGLTFYFNDDISRFNNFFQINLDMAVEWINPQFSRKNYLPKHTALISDQSSIHLWNETFPSWEEAMNYAGIMMQTYRKRYQPDYQTIKNFIHNGTVPSKIEKSAFGLPMPVQYKSLFRRYFINYVQKKLKDLEVEKTPRDLESISKRKWDAIRQLEDWQIYNAEQLWKKAEQNSKADIDGVFVEEINDEKARLRRSSPLFIKIVRINDQEYSLIFLFLPSDFLAENAKVKISAKDRRPELIETTDFTAVENFLRDEIFPNSTPISF